MEKKIRVGRHWLTINDLQKRIIDKIPKATFCKAVKAIERDLNREHPLKKGA